MVVMNKTRLFGFTYLLVAIGLIYNESSAVVLTPNHLAYSLYPMNDSSFSLKIRAPQDAHILLTYHPNDTNPVYEIYLGGWKNTRSAIRLNHTRPEKRIVNSAGLLSAKEFRGFWVNCSQGLVAVGKEGETVPFLEWVNPNPFEVRYYGIRTAWGATGEWIIDDPSALHGQVDQYDLHLGLPGFVAVDVVAPTSPSLTWKIRSFIISDGNYDPNGRYYAARAYMEAIGMWQARLFIFNVTQEDTEENILLTTRVRGQVGGNTYQVNLYISNATTPTENETICLNQAGVNITDFQTSILTDGFSNQPVYKATSPKSALRNTTLAPLNAKELGSITKYVLQNTSQSPITTVHITKTETGNIISSTRVVAIMPIQASSTYLTTPKIIQTTTALKALKSYTTQNSLSSVTHNFDSSNITQTVIRKTTANVNISKMSEIENGVVTHLNKPSRTWFEKTTTKLMRKNYPTTKAFVVETKSPKGTQVAQHQPFCKENGDKSNILISIIGVLVTALVVVLSLVSRATFKYKKMTGDWWFTAKFHASIPMDDINDDESNSLIPN